MPGSTRMRWGWLAALTVAYVLTGKLPLDPRRTGR